MYLVVCVLMRITLHKEGAEKHEIYAAAFGGDLFYD